MTIRKHTFMLYSDALHSWMDWEKMVWNWVKRNVIYTTVMNIYAWYENTNISHCILQIKLEFSSSSFWMNRHMYHLLASLTHLTNILLTDYYFHSHLIHPSLPPIIFFTIFISSLTSYFVPIYQLETILSNTINVSRRQNYIVIKKECSKPNSLKSFLTDQPDLLLLSSFLQELEAKVCSDSECYQKLSVEKN